MSIKPGTPSDDPLVHKGEEQGHLPEGLAGGGGTTRVECENPACLHEWEIVTHGQIRACLRGWRASSTGGRLPF